MIRVRAVVTGTVQGVGFRYATYREAQRLGLAGLVRNQADGGVEVEAEGDADAVGQLVTWLKAGPAHARVRQVRVSGREPRGDTGFEVEGDT
ncbi:acylphosphatase [Sanguibacter gelidistatuariae]|uniref:acylphosphatase n=1 Tax=Sanguibacter gelidistatuariae TaxID=1814289 RepID=A0A1G6GS33_9MICO|nr:acylphosphatase [Sanguibacter gelidistatuariae]SDB84731.1 acylphosphatase [Sanguibacter gelidistatuariae]